MSVHQAENFLDHCLTGTVVRRAVVTSVLVGTILNLINQGGNFFGSGVSSNIIWWKIALTYSVPYFVATVSSALERAKIDRPKC